METMPRLVLGAALSLVGACSQGVGNQSVTASATIGTIGSASVADDGGTMADDAGTATLDGSASLDGATTDPSDSDSESDSVDGSSDGGPAFCGDGMVEGEEECDLGDENADTAACKSDCTAQACGDGFVGPGEGCDDGNPIDGDECSNDCMLASCGDGVVNPGESCDDGNADDTDACPSICQNAVCGDGFVQTNVEQCDDVGGSASCDVDCTTSSCGDGQTNPLAGEQCDDGNGSNSDACPSSCQNAVCGDGFLYAGVEECDDDNNGDGDGCSGGCLSEVPDVCQQGNDPFTGAPWVVCSADATSAWISANNQGTYHPVTICQSLGYNTVGSWGGTCGDVCGYCQGGVTSCAATGNANFDFGAWAGVGNCGNDGNGETICITVMWTCTD
jgi:cysteine-rich repeat protein